MELINTHIPDVINWYIDCAFFTLPRYACGPTVYAQSHIGHARYVRGFLPIEWCRTYVSLDLMRRVMEGLDGGCKVRMVMGITDVDDKIIDRARLTGVTLGDVSQRYEAEFISSLKSLNVRSIFFAQHKGPAA